MLQVAGGQPGAGISSQDNMRLKVQLDPSLTGSVPDYRRHQKFW